MRNIPLRGITVMISGWLPSEIWRQARQRPHGSGMPFFPGSPAAVFADSQLSAWANSLAADFFPMPSMPENNRA